MKNIKNGNDRFSEIFVLFSAICPPTVYFKFTFFEKMSNISAMFVNFAECA